MNAIEALYSSSKEIDLLTVRNHLKASQKVEEAGGDVYFSELMSEVSTTLNLSTHIEIVQGKFDVRRIIETCNNALTCAYDPKVDPVELLGGIESGIQSICEKNEKTKAVHLSETIGPSLKNISEARKRGGIPEIPTGFKKLDELTGGFHGGDLVIIAARPGMGKTSLALNIAEYCGVPASFFSVEMPNIQLTQKIQSKLANVPLFKIRNGLVNDREFETINRVSTQVASLPIYVDDDGYLNIVTFRSKLRRLIRKHNVGLGIIDYLQIMKGLVKNQEPVRRITEITGTLKAIAKEFNIPIIALSQLNRALENRPLNSRRPKLSDLKDSGSIEQDADMILFPYRHEVYSKDASDKGKAEIIIAKQRNGPTDISCEVVFEGPITTFRDIDYGNKDEF